jgi:hypothetical protein
MRQLPFTPSKIPDTSFCQRVNRTQGHSAAGRIRSVEKSDDLIRNRSSEYVVKTGFEIKMLGTVLHTIKISN